MEFLSEFSKNHWLFFCFLAPALWAVVNVVDIYFVHGVYKDELDGTIIAGLVQIIPALVLLLFLQIRLNEFVHINSNGHYFWIDPVVLLAIAGGFLFTSSFYFYFKALFHKNDAALLQIFWGLTIVVVPLLAFLFWGEKLSVYKYIGMGVTLLGAVILSISEKLKSRFSKKYLWIICGAVIFLSTGMVFADRAYTIFSDRGLGNQGFLLGFFCFSIGGFMSGILFAILGKRNPINFIKRYYKTFLVIEAVTFLGNFASQRAIDVTPSVSFVATIETFVPVFIMVFSFLIFIYLHFFQKKSDLVKDIYKEQFNSVWVKIFAIIIMAVGVYVIS